MALKSSREGLRKELVDYLGNLIVDDNLRNEIVKAVGDKFVTSEVLNENVNNLTMQITTENGERIEADNTLQNNINAETTAREQAISTLEEAIANIPSISPLIAYPIGSVYLSVNDTNPSTILGGGTWELIGSKLAVRENVVGNGLSLALTNGSTTSGTLAGADGVALAVHNSIWGTPLGGESYGSASIDTNKAIGVPTKAQLGDTPQYSGLIVDTETIYSWKRIV